MLLPTLSIVRTCSKLPVLQVHEATVSCRLKRRSRSARAAHTESPIQRPQQTGRTGSTRHRPARHRVKSARFAANFANPAVLRYGGVHHWGGIRQDMSELLQSGQHPDADQLSAFIEHVLPAHEQEETLAHLAVCPACRSIVALSLPAVEEQPIPRPVRRPWLSGWNLVWSGSAALAAMVLVGMLLRNGPSVPSRVRNDVPPAQTARAAPPSPPVVHHQLLPRAAGPPTEQAPSLSATASTKASSPLGRHDRLLPTAPAGVVAGIASRAATPGSTAAQSTVSVVAANDALQLEKVAVRSTLLSDQAQDILSHHPLPSGLPARSAAATRQAAAIDAHNNLFLSDDGGEHWRATLRRGRAVR